MNNRSLFFAVALLLIVCIGLSVWAKVSSPRIAYVRSAVVVQSYQGMKDANSLYKEKIGKWKANIDTLQLDYQRSLSQYNMDASKLSGKAKMEKEEYLRKQEMNLRQYAGALEQKAKEEDTKMTEGVLNQINSYIKEYGEKNGYDLILGVTLNGNILYGKEAIDVTEDVLKGLNQNYKPSAATK